MKFNLKYFNFYTIYSKKPKTKLNNIQIITPKAVGNKKETSNHFMLLVSLKIVISVVAHGKWKTENIIKQIAVLILQLFLANISLIASALSIEINSLFSEYVIKQIGKTISFAGIPKTKEVNISPSKPISLPSGVRNEIILFKITLSPKFSSSQIIIPAGKATATALPKTKIVLFKSERVITFVICGFL